MSVAPLLELHNASVHYAGAPEAVLQNIHFSLKPGERVGLVGPNGSGKTTLLLSLVGLVPLQQGELRFQGSAVRAKSAFVSLRRAVGFVFQNPDDQLFSPTVLEDVAFGLLNLGLDQTEVLDQSMAMLERLHLDHLAQRQPHTLSGGQKRLVSLATVLVMSPQALLLDEPTNDLDTSTRALVMDILKSGTIMPHTPALVIASHDQALLNALTDRSFELG